jgi:IS5 family transposase
MDKPKLTKRQKFLQEMEQVISWDGGQGGLRHITRRLGEVGVLCHLETMLRVHLMQQRFGDSDPAMKESLHDIPKLREFAGLDVGEDAMPNETTILVEHRGCCCGKEAS